MDKLILDTVDSVRRFDRSMRRQEQTRKRNESFDENEFKMEDQLDQLKSQNMVIKID